MLRLNVIARHGPFSEHGHRDLQTETKRNICEQCSHNKSETSRYKKNMTGG